jgi:hypothetical protein
MPSVLTASILAVGVAVATPKKPCVLSQKRFALDPIAWLLVK